MDLLQFYSRWMFSQSVTHCFVWGRGAQTVWVWSQNWEGVRGVQNITAMQLGCLEVGMLRCKYLTWNENGQVAGLAIYCTSWYGERITWHHAAHSGAIETMTVTSLTVLQKLHSPYITEPVQSTSDRGEGIHRGERALLTVKGPI